MNIYIVTRLVVTRNQVDSTHPFFFTGIFGIELTLKYIITIVTYFTPSLEQVLIVDIPYSSINVRVIETIQYIYIYIYKHTYIYDVIILCISNSMRSFLDTC